MGGGGGEGGAVVMMVVVVVLGLRLACPGWWAPSCIVFPRSVRNANIPRHAKRSKMSITQGPLHVFFPGQYLALK